jgi:WD40 repeat protein/DNA-binding SARP family transcriptional activator
MEFRILGPLEVVANGHPVEVTAPKLRALLAVLLLSANHVVSSDRIIDDLWGEEPPGGGLNTLKFHVSKLRDALQPGRRPGEEGSVVTRSPGYMLVVDPDSVDAARFERLVRAARSSLTSDPALASDTLQEALDLWRGHALEDFQGESFATIEALHLEELRLAALEDRIEADLALGRHAELAGELERLVSEHPFRERMWGQLMVALYRSDRQAEALRSFQQLRTQLGEQLGIGPSPELVALEERILFQDAVLKKPGAVQPPGGRLRGYELQEKLGEGAAGVVWRAVQPAVGRDVAIKVIKPRLSNQPDFVRRFEAEARLIASLEHPFIVPVFDFWRDPDGAYLVMRLMGNGGLDRLPATPWEPARVVRVVAQIASGLAYAHRRGLQHADLHPGNVLLDSEGNAYLADFGLAASLDFGSTPPGGYASPEQRAGEPASKASDMFGLGTLVFRLLTGTDPPGGPLPSVHGLRSDLPVEIDDVLAKATASHPEQRFHDVDEFLELLRAAAGRAQAEPTAELRNPYKGLRAFGEADAPDFFGRQSEVDDLVAAVVDNRLVGVVGPSGSGKSSLVRAGLLPALRTGQGPGSQTWLTTDMYPGTDPFSELTDALLRVAVQHPRNLSEQLGDPGTVAGAVRSVLPSDDELLIVIDQFEELFTLCEQVDVRRRFMDTLASLATDPKAGVRIVVTMRADFFGLPLEYQPFGDLLRGAVVSITPPKPEELAKAITRPAEHVGLELEPDLTGIIVRDVSEQPGGLPLMEYALTQLFEQRSGRRLTVEAYQRTGGVTGALGQWPEQLYLAFDEPTRIAARQIFLRLVNVDEGGQNTRRRVPVPELSQLGIEQATVAEVLDQFGSARLLTFDRDPQTRTPTVEVAHEALLERWDRLREWVANRREHLLLQRRLQQAHQEWEDSTRNDAYLLQGGRLRQFETFAEETDLAFTDTEREFLEASSRQEAASSHRRRRRRRLVASGLLVLALAASSFGIVALAQRNEANEKARAADEQAAIAAQQTDLAQQQTDLAKQQTAKALDNEQLAQTGAAEATRQERIAKARGLAAAAVDAIDTDPNLSLLLATSAVEVTRDADGTIIREAEEALHDAVSADRLVSVAPADLYTRDLAFSPDSNEIYVGGFLQSEIEDETSGELEEMLPFDTAAVAVAGPDDEWLVVAGFGGNITVRDRESMEELFTLDGHTDWITDLDTARNGTLLASISPYDGSARVWDLTTRTQIAEFTLDCEQGECPGGVALGDGGSVLMTGAIRWDVATGERSDIPEGFDSQGRPVAFIDQHLVAVGDGNLVRLLDLDTGEVTGTLRRHTGPVLSIDVSPDGRYLATGGREGLAYLWERDESGAHIVSTLPGHVGPLWKVQFSPDGRYVATISGSQEWPADVVVDWPRTWEVRLWDVSAAGSHEWMTTVAGASAVSFTPDGTSVLATNTDSGASLWDATSGEELDRYAPPVAGETATAGVLSPNGTLIALAGITGADEGWCVIEDAITGELLRELMPPDPDADPHDLAFSPDGTRLAMAAGPFVRVWNTSTWRVVLDEQRPPAQMEPSAPTHGFDAIYGSVTFSPDGSLLATQGFLPQTDEFGSVMVWNLESGELIMAQYHFPSDGVGDVAFSPDGRMLVTTGIARPIIYEPFTGRELGSLHGPSANGIAAAFSPDGTRIATAEGDGTVRLWDATTAEETLVLPAQSDSLASVAFSPDGTRLASLSSDGELRVWALDIDDLLDMARGRVTRDLTDAECRAYIGEGCPPAPAIERLVPAQSEAAGPIGISNDAWASAPSGGSWEQFEAPSPQGDPLLYDTQFDTLVVMSLAGPSVFDRATGTWTVGTPALEVPEDIAAEVGNAEPTLGAAAYHRGLDRILVSRTDDGATLAYDVHDDSWTELAPDGPFVTRYGQGMIYDTESDVLVSFGGAEWGRIENGKHRGLPDTWAYDADTNSWVDRTPATSPPGRVNHGIVYDSAADRIVVFGGSTGFGVGEVLGDTWAYDTNTNTWTEMKPAVSPPARGYAAMWYDPTANLTFLFGGSEDTSWPPLPWKMFGAEELWAYDYEANTWTLYRTDRNPGYWLGSGSGNVTFDSETGEAILTGGDWYDENRQYQGGNTAVWTLRFEPVETP